MRHSLNKKIRPYGFWGSPISAAMLSQRLRLEDVQWDSDGVSLIWLEGRSGKGALVFYTDEGARRDLAQEQNVHARVGYGGGDYCVSHGTVYFVDKGGCIYRRGTGYGRPSAITPPSIGAASPLLSPDGKWLVFVSSDGRNDLLGMVDSAGKEWPWKLARGADFYMQPAWHPDSKRLAWVEWDHPNMPWDGARLMLGNLSGEYPRLVSSTCIAGDASTPISQPEFSPDGQWLAYISTSGEWEVLVLHHLESGEKKTLVGGDGKTLSLPAWVQGMRNYGWSPDGSNIFYIQYKNGYASIWVVDLESGRSSPLDTSPYTWLQQISVSKTAEKLAFIASAPGIPDRIVVWEGGKMRTVCHSEAESVSPEMFASPKLVSWMAEDGTRIHGLFYHPTSTEYEGEGLPPAIIYAHGGPTSAETSSYDPERSYFTSRGYAWLEVNYRGSSGYGRTYQDALRGRWGEVDTLDCAGGAKFLADEKLADPGKLVIMGSSAGGYTVLNSLIRFPGLYKAGVNKYGVSNLFTFALDTHKFEEHYQDSLVGTLPTAAAKFQEWSPFFHAEKIRDPLAVFQGKEDRVVPPSQSETIVDALKQSGVPHIYRLYEGEGHGFRKSETIADFLQQTECFLQQHVLFST